MLRTPWTESRAIRGTVIKASRSSGGVPGTTIIRGSRCAAFVSTGSRCSAAHPARPVPNPIGLRLVGLEDAQRVVGDQVGERVGDPVEQRVETVLGKDVVEDVSEPAIRIH